MNEVLKSMPTPPTYIIVQYTSTMDTALVTGLKRRIEELEQEVRDKRKVESDARNVQARLEELQRTITSDDDPTACVVCAEATRAVLPCGHRLCQGCMRSVTRSKLCEDYSHVNCPCCRRVYAFDYDPRLIEIVDHRAVRAFDPNVNYVAPCALGIWKKDAPLARSYLRQYLMRMDEWIRQPTQECVRTHVFAKSFSAPSSPTYLRE